VSALFARTESGSGGGGSGGGVPAKDKENAAAALVVPMPHRSALGRMWAGALNAGAAWIADEAAAPSAPRVGTPGAGAPTPAAQPPRPRVMQRTPQQDGIARFFTPAGGAPPGGKRASSGAGAAPAKRKK
jgi:hypothetical protein